MTVDTSAFPNAAKTPYRWARRWAAHERNLDAGGQSAAVAFDPSPGSYAHTHSNKRPSLWILGEGLRDMISTWSNGPDSSLKRADILV